MPLLNIAQLSHQALDKFLLTGHTTVEQKSVMEWDRKCTEKPVKGEGRGREEREGMYTDTPGIATY